MSSLPRGTSTSRAAGRGGLLHRPGCPRVDAPRPGRRSRHDAALRGEAVTTAGARRCSLRRACVTPRQTLVKARRATGPHRSSSRQSGHCVAASAQKEASAPARQDECFAYARARPRRPALATPIREKQSCTPPPRDDRFHPLAEARRALDGAFDAYVRARVASELNARTRVSRIGCSRRRRQPSVV